MTYRFRASIYFDIFIDEQDEDDNERTPEKAREIAQQDAEKVVSCITGDPEGCDPALSDINCSNPYIGGVARYNPQNLLKPLDREI